MFGSRLSEFPYCHCGVDMRYVDVAIFSDTKNANSDDDDNLTTIQVPYNTLLAWFKENVYEDFEKKHLERDSGPYTEDTLLAEWLDEYTADETVGLFSYVQAKQKAA